MNVSNLFSYRVIQSNSLVEAIEFDLTLTLTLTLYTRIIKN